MTAPAVSSSRFRRAAGVLLAALLLLLAFRLTSAMFLRDTLAQKRVAVELAAAPQTAGANWPIPLVDTVFTAAYAALMFLLAALASFLAAHRGALPRRRLGQFALIALLLALALASTLRAANRFNALIGTADLAAALAAAWTTAVLCDERVLGARGRQAVIAALIAIFALGCAKAALQKFVEFPRAIQMARDHPNTVLRNNGLNPDDPAQQALFLARLGGAQVTGYGAMSNVFAAQMIACVALLAGLVAAGILMPRPTPAPARTSRRAPEHPPDRFPRRRYALLAAGLLLLVSFVILALTGSKGGMASAILAAAAIGLGVYYRKPLAARRQLLPLAAGALTVGLPAAVIGWGIARHGLPTPSLLFRWQYWTATARMIENQPLWGVGFNNFGDYYPRYKLPSAPEDVKDPHSFFLRFAAELGIPAALAVGALLLWMLHGAWMLTVESAAAPDAPGPGLRPALTWGALAAGAWVPLHFLAESATPYSLLLTPLLALAAWAVFAAILALFAALRAAATRALVLAAVIGALAMLLYDQVNVALVTGPVAMLFWVMLALGESTLPAARSGADHPPSQWLWSLPLALLALSLATTLALLIPMAYDDFAWDPAPHEYAYIRQISAGPTMREHVIVAGQPRYAYVHQISAADATRAAESLAAAIALAPNSIELRLQRIALQRDVLHQPVRDEIRRVLALDNANAGLRLLLALPDSDLPPAERIAALQQALEFDRQLPPGEARHLTADQLRQIDAAIARLR